MKTYEIRKKSPAHNIAQAQPEKGYAPLRTALSTESICLHHIRWVLDGMEFGE